MKIALKTHDGKHYLQARNAGGSAMMADAPWAREWETFDVVGPFVFGGRISLRTHDGIHYVCAENGGGAELVANRTAAQQWESFQIIGSNGKVNGTPVQSGDKISFKTYDGIHYLQARNGGGSVMMADAPWTREWETFTVNIIAPAAPLSPTRIIHISDLHFSDSSTTVDVGTIIDSQDSQGKSNLIANYLINNASQLGTKTLIITGDLTDSGDGGDYKIAKAFIQKLTDHGFVVYANPGNHDYCKEGLLAMGWLPLVDDNTTRRQRFIDYITHYNQYPHVENFGNCRLILLDSMQGELDQNTGDDRAQGKLGQPQLSLLKQLLAGYEPERKAGKKIIVSLHHSPFHHIKDDEDGGLVDSEEFLGIIANKIDCLLFGHTTPDPKKQMSFPDEEKRHGIPLINCENLEHVEYSNCKITILDMGCNRKEVYPTDISQYPEITIGNPPEGIHITPIVNRNVAVYNYSDAAPTVRFQSGDVVTITAGGGVQTGGKGKTWKRYVNPSGDNSNRFYFGQIYIPGITSQLTPIRDLVRIYGSYDSQRSDKCTFKVAIPNIDSFPESSRYLSLGYTDDDYNDNGYWRHDDGTEDQCKGVGSAYIDINIQHGSLPKTIEFTITPVVTQKTPVIYNGVGANPSIPFQQGDNVTVIAGGGVQTGGKGKTWKRYVNPSGKNSARLYFGQIYIPGITPGFTAIRDLVAKYGSYDKQSPDKCILTFTIPNIDTIPAANRYLSLHYIDDGYSDNGYWGHDDGTENQCKNVGNAFVYIKIQR